MFGVIIGPSVWFQNTRFMLVQCNVDYYSLQFEWKILSIQLTALRIISLSKLKFAPTLIPNPIFCQNPKPSCSPIKDFAGSCIYSNNFLLKPIITSSQQKICLKKTFFRTIKILLLIKSNLHKLSYRITWKAICSKHCKIKNTHWKNNINKQNQLYNIMAQ